MLIVTGTYSFNSYVTNDPKLISFSWALFRISSLEQSFMKTAFDLINWLEMQASQCIGSSKLRVVGKLVNSSQNSISLWELPSSKSTLIICGSSLRLGTRVHSSAKNIRPWWDSNPQSSAPEADALSIRPQGQLVTGSAFHAIYILSLDINNCCNSSLFHRTNAAKNVSWVLTWPLVAHSDSRYSPVDCNPIF